MSDSVRIAVREVLGRAVPSAATELDLTELLAHIPFARPKRAEHGDDATNVALGIAKQVGTPSRGLGETIAKRLREVGAADFAEVTDADPGFVNVRRSNTFWQRRLLDIRKAGNAWGRGEPT